MAANSAILYGPPLADEAGLGALTLPGWLREVTDAFGPREALVFGDVRWTYAELWTRAEEVARALLALGCGKDARVGVLMTNRPEWLAAVFGASIAGAIAVPLSSFSTEAELGVLLRDADVGILLAERLIAGRDFATILANLVPEVAATGERSTRFPHLRHVVLVGEPADGFTFESCGDFLARAAAIPAELTEATAAAVRPTDVGAILFSSGSTAQPKGVVHAQRGMVIMFWRWRRLMALNDDARCWTPNGFFWSGNFGCALGATLSAGGALILQSIFEPAAALALMAREKVTYPYAWPHQWKQVVEAPNWRDVDLGAMIYVDPSIALATHPTIRPSGWREPAFSYGSTETFTVTASYPADAPRAVMAGAHGFALPGNTIRIVDPDTDEVVARGVQGEIAVKGATLMLGYLGQPIEQSFDAAGFFHTGDAGWIDGQDRLHFDGRLSTVIKTGGANVSPLEIDIVLEAMPGVKVARCVGVPDPAFGELVVACIVPAEGATLSAEAVRAHARGALAAYKVPRRYLFITEQDLLLTATHKIKPAALRDLAIKRLEPSEKVES